MSTHRQYITNTRPLITIDLVGDVLAVAVWVTALVVGFRRHQFDWYFKCSIGFAVFFSYFAIYNTRKLLKQRRNRTEEL